MKLRNVFIEAAAWCFLPLAVYYKFGIDVLTLVLLPCAVVTPHLVFIDIRKKILPNKFIYPAIFATLLIITCFAISQGSFAKFTQPVSRAVIISGLAFILYVISRGKIGAGDVKLFFLTGLVLGVFSPEHLIMSQLITSVAVLIFTVTLLALKRVTVKTRIAFGPFILLGTWLTVFLFN